MLPKPFESK